MVTKPRLPRFFDEDKGKVFCRVRDIKEGLRFKVLARNCAERRPGREPYELSEYIALLIRQDDARVRGRIKAISANRCGKCGDSLPVKSCP